MRWNRPQDENGNLNDVNMTPLIDVSLVLVVILLLATPLAFESSFGVRKTAATARQASDEKKEARIELAIESQCVVVGARGKSTDVKRIDRPGKKGIALIQGTSFSQCRRAFDRLKNADLTLKKMRLPGVATGRENLGGIGVYGLHQE